jgi:hypothetical protein
MVGDVTDTGVRADRLELEITEGVFLAGDSPTALSLG